MKNKTLSFMKNAGIATAAAVVAGWGSSELADKFIDNGKVIGVLSTISQYFAWFGTFLPLHARDNREIYEKDGKFDWGQFTKDNLKFGGAFAALDLLYILGRPLVQDYFIRHGSSPSSSSLYSDCVAFPFYAALAIPIAKFSGIIKGRKGLENKIKE